MPDALGTTVEAHGVDGAATSSNAVDATTPPSWTALRHSRRPNSFPFPPPSLHHHPNITRIITPISPQNPYTRRLRFCREVLHPGVANSKPGKGKLASGSATEVLSIAECTHAVKVVVVSFS